jgi:drug/metabolite transporter (DMT)-like permease
VWTALGLVYVFWGSTYLAISFVVDTLPALLSASLRFAVAQAILLVFLLLRRGRTALRATRRQIAWATGIGALLLLGGNGMVTLAEQRELPSGLAALLVAAVPLWVVVLRASTGDRPAGRTLLGVGIGFVGVAVLLLPGARPAGVALLPALLVVLSSLLWSCGSFLATRVDLPADALLTTVVQMVGGSLALGLGGLVRGEQVDVSGFSSASMLAWGYLVVFGSLVAFTAYSWLLGVAPLSKVSTYAYVNPVVAVLLGVTLAGEAVGAVTVLGGAVTVLAVALVVSEEGRRRRDTVVEVPADAPVARPGALYPSGYDPEDRQGRVRSDCT